MTDNEIIKALECCINCNCEECPCYKVIGTEKRCTEIDEEEILDLINRQKAEIEALINGQETLQKRIAEKMAKIEQLKAEKVKLHTLIPKMLAEAKFEAIKEFEKLVTRRLNCNTPRGAYLLNIMNEVKKEMMESQ